MEPGQNSLSVHIPDDDLSIEAPSGKVVRRAVGHTQNVVLSQRGGKPANCEWSAYSLGLCAYFVVVFSLPAAVSFHSKYLEYMENDTSFKLLYVSRTTVWWYADDHAVDVSHLACLERRRSFCSTRQPGTCACPGDVELQSPLFLGLSASPSHTALPRVPTPVNRVLACSVFGSRLVLVAIIQYLTIVLKI